MSADLSKPILAGDMRAIARGISVVENGGAPARDLVRAIFPATGRAFLVGVTGAPGAGKSTIVDALTGRWRRQGKGVGVIAVDPTSPFTGGAMLGDRVRMQRHAQDSGVFIRSMATRGHLGGLAGATADAALVLDAAGKEIVAIETVGVGQDEVEIIRTADVCVVVLVPGMGDDVQALKAGIMEIADVFVVNKSEREGADRTVGEIESLLSLHNYRDGEWVPPIVRTQATSGVGIEQLESTIEDFRRRSASLVAERRKQRASARLRSVLVDRLMSRVESGLTDVEFHELVDRISAGKMDPYTAAEEVIGRWERA